MRSFCGQTESWSAANNVNGSFSGDKFERIRLYPGDQIVVPYKLPTGAFIRGLRDWTQIGSQLALTAAALADAARPSEIL